MNAEDQTQRYVNMIESFECDFSLAVGFDGYYGLSDLQSLIEDGDKKLLSDIRLLQELSFGLRNGTLRIIKCPVT